MMRILIPFVATLGISLGASTGFVMMRTPAHAAHDAAVVKPDSTHTVQPSTAAAHPDSTHVAPASADSAATQPIAPANANASQATPVVPGASTSAVASAGHGDAPAALGPAPHQTVPVRPAAPQPAHSDSVEKRLAKVFSAMQARDAAHILQQMDDNDVQVILASLSPKQQAGILGQFPPQRAATLARATLRSTGDDQ